MVIHVGVWKEFPHGSTRTFHFIHSVITSRWYPIPMGGELSPTVLSLHAYGRGVSCKDTLCQREKSEKLVSVLGTLAHVVLGTGVERLAP